MLLSCTIAFAGFCFSGIPIGFDGVDAGMGYRVHVETGTYVAESRGADAERPLDWRTAPKACLDDTCLRYWKRCTDAKPGLRCEYTFTGASVGESAYYRAISVTVSNEAALSTAESRIAIELGEGKDAAMLPLGLLTERSSGEAPFCPDGLKPAVCRPHIP
jgi:hypothetical protein